MSTYTIYSNNKIDWSAKGRKRILQNITNLLNTNRYEVAYDRVLGRNSSNLDKPLEQMIPLVIAETHELINEYFPKINLKSVEVTFEENKPILKVVIEFDE